MCGILGTIPATDENIFKIALDKLKHRGPDSYGIVNIDNNITLGHRRLAIIDLSNNAHQPFFDVSKRFCIVFNGEIYNFLEIRQELEKKGYKFRSLSDTEVLLYSYIEWGENCVLKFNGMWAFAIWDNLKKELFLSRDRFGKKPLFYTYVDNKFVFASEMKAIYPFLKEIKPSKDFHWMKNNIFMYETTEKCLIEGIKRFPLGHIGSYKNGKLITKRYWNTLDNLIVPPPSYEEQVERFRELFFDACKIRMRADVKIGTALSGGVDSSCVISAMAHISRSALDYGKKDWQHAFVACFPETPLDESYYAKKVVDYLGIKAIFVNIDPLKYWDKIEEYFYMFEELYLTSPIPMIALYSAVKQHGISVTLDGHGADELFSGYGYFLEALWDNKFSLKNSIDILKTYQQTMSRGEQFKQGNIFRVYLEYMIKKIAKLILGKGIKSRDSNHPNFKKLDNFSQHLYIIFHETVLPTLLRNYDRYSMINGVEIRMPFMDHRIVSFVFSLPSSSKFGNGYTKRLLRDAMNPYMPQEITWRKSKIGFNSPIVNWMQKDLKEWFLDVIHEKDFLESSLIESPLKLQKQILDIVNKKISSFAVAEEAWTKLTPYIWEKSIKKFARR